MALGIQFRKLLPITQTVLAAFFGGWGLWLRNEYLSHYSPFGWNSTERFHVWPWPYKFAVVSNMPALFAGGLISCAGSDGRCNTIWYKAVFKGGVYETRETVWAFAGAEERDVASLEGRADVA